MAVHCYARQPLLFPHRALEGRLNDGSRMNGDVHDRLQEGVGVQFLSTRLFYSTNAHPHCSLVRQALDLACQTA